MLPVLGGISGSMSTILNGCIRRECIPLNPSAMLAFFSMQGYYPSLATHYMTPLPHIPTPDKTG
jgi:hypothetical protein